MKAGGFFFLSVDQFFILLKFSFLFFFKCCLPLSWCLDNVCQEAEDRVFWELICLSVYLWYIYLFILSFVLLGPHPWHMEVPKLGVESELLLPAYAWAIAMPNPGCVSHVCDLYHSSWKLWILNPLIEARDWTRNLMVPSWIRFCCTTRGTPIIILKLIFTSVLRTLYH